MTENIVSVEQCSLCGLPHGKKTGPRKHKRTKACSICDLPRDSSGRYCKKCRAQYMRGHRNKLTSAPEPVDNQTGAVADQVIASD